MDLCFNCWVSQRKVWHLNGEHFVWYMHVLRSWMFILGLGESAYRLVIIGLSFSDVARDHFLSRPITWRRARLHRMDFRVNCIGSQAEAWRLCNDEPYVDGCMLRECLYWVLANRMGDICYWLLIIALIFSQWCGEGQFSTQVVW